MAVRAVRRDIIGQESKLQREGKVVEGKKFV
jgi:hypothetical protein